MTEPLPVTHRVVYEEGEEKDPTGMTTERSIKEDREEVVEEQRAARDKAAEKAKTETTTTRTTTKKEGS